MKSKSSRYITILVKGIMAIFIIFLFCLPMLNSSQFKIFDNTKHLENSFNLKPFLLSVNPVLAASSNKTNSLSLDKFTLNVTSSSKVHGIAGEFIKINGTITNNNPSNSVKSGIAYISIVDMKDKVPIDLEDWSASKGLYIPIIKGGQTLPIEWNIRLVKAGSYTIEMLFNPDGNLEKPSITSSRISMEVSPKVNLNPGNVLPVAFGTPIIVITILGIIGVLRGKATRMI